MKKQKTTLRDFFKSYPYKKKSTESTGGVNYIPKQEIIDNHQFSITGNEYIAIIKEYVDVMLFEYMIWGGVYKMPHKFGQLVFRKCKNTSIESKRSNVDYGTTNKLYKEWNKQNPNNKKVIFHKNYHSQGYGVYLKWDKKQACFTNKYVTLFTLARAQRLKLGKILKENITIINYLNES